MKQKMLIGAFLLLLAAAGVIQAAIPEDAQRHMARGMAAMEIAKSPSDYQKAVAEFQAAIRLAPEWADAWFNLGVAQESAGDYAGAIASFKSYLAKNPGASDRDAVKTRLYKLEFKQEQAQAERQARVQKLAGTWVHQYTNGGMLVSETFWDLVPKSTNSFELRHKYTKDHVYQTIPPIKHYMELTLQGESISGMEYTQQNYSAWNCNRAFLVTAPLSGTLAADGTSMSLVRGSHRGVDPRRCDWQHEAGGYKQELKKR